MPRRMAACFISLAKLREVLADADARHRRVDRLELAADVRRRVGLRVERVDVAGPAGHPQQDARLGPRPVRGRRRQPPEPAAQRRAGGRRGQELPPAQGSGASQSPARASVLSGSVKTRWSSSGPRPVPGTPSRAEPASGRRGPGTAAARRPWAAATGSSGTGRRRRRPADRPGFASRAASAATFRPANCPEFICRSRCGMPRRYAVGSGSPSSAKNWVNSARALCRASTPASAPAGRGSSRASRTTARPRGP